MNTLTKNSEDGNSPDEISVSDSSRLGVITESEDIDSEDSPQWEQMPSLVVARECHSSCTVESKAVYVFCGFDR